MKVVAPRVYRALQGATGLSLQVIQEKIEAYEKQQAKRIVDELDQHLDVKHPGSGEDLETFGPDLPSKDSVRAIGIPASPLSVHAPR